MESSPASARGRQRLNPIVVLAALIVVVAGLDAAEDILVPLVLSAFLAVLSAPVVMKLHARGVPDAVAVPLVMLGVLAAVVGVGTLLGTSINRFVGALPQYQERLRESSNTLFEWARQYGVSTGSLRRLADPGAVLDIVGRTMSGVAASLQDAFLVVLTTAFMLFEVSGIPRKLRRALGNPTADLSQLERIMLEIKNYIVIKTYVSAATGGVLAGFTAATGLDFPLLWGLLAFLLNYVPNIGSILAAVPAVLFAALQLGLTHALITLAGFVLVNVVFGNLVEPRLMGKKLGLSTLVVWVSLVFWGWLWGPIGMFLSVPLTMMVKILLEHSPRFNAIAVLMDAPKG